jgi:hypothetical protein
LPSLAINHYFPSFNDWLDDLPDPRNPEMIQYSTRHLMTMGLTMFLTHAGSRNQFNEDRKTETFVENFTRMIGEDLWATATMDTVFYLLKHLPSDGLDLIPGKMVAELLKSRVLESYRFNGDYLIAIDGTEIYRSEIRHCDKCLVQKHRNGTIHYFHTVLEAKLVTPQGMSLSLGTVFVENESDTYDKQDCELRAFYRFAPVLKEMFPRLRICLLMDSLYANEEILKICERYCWSYFIAFKEGSIPSLYKEAFTRLEQYPENSLVAINTDGESETYRWVCNLKYRSQTTHLVTADIPEVVKGRNSKTQKEMTRFVYLTDNRPSENNVITYVNSGGRQRSKIEESFNVQKNSGLNLEHNYGAQGNAYKNSYYLLQIAHTILQLIVNSDMMSKLIREKYANSHRKKPTAHRTNAMIAMFRTILMAYNTTKNFASKLMESLRTIQLDDYALDPEFARRIKVKLIFDSS